MKKRSAQPLPVPNFAARAGLLGALLLALAPQLLRMPALLGILCAALWGWRAFHDFTGRALPGNLMRLAVTAVSVAAVVASYRTLLGRDAGVSLLAIMLCLKLLEMRSERDAMLSVFLGYFLVVTGFLYSQSIFMGVYMFGVVLAFTAALVALSHPAARPGYWRSYLRTGSGLLLQALPMMMLLFVLFPRIPGPLWGLPKDAFAGRTGLSDEMSIGNISSLASSNDVAFRVKFDGPVPPARELYWRGPVLWNTDGQRWTRLAPWQMRQFANQKPSFQTSADPVTYTITLQPHDQRWLLALDLPATLPDDSDITPGFQIVSGTKVETLRRYQVTSYTRYRTTDPDPRLEHYALLQPRNVNPRTQNLARSWVQAGLRQEQLINRALNYFRNEPFYYSRQPVPARENPLDRFMFDSRKGFCEHYAAAFTVLMRAAGLPARVVTGYQGGELNELGDYLVVRQSDAHAWSEVFLEDRGWVRVDPTAVIPPERVETALDAQRFRSISGIDLSSDGLLFLRKAWNKLSQGWDALNNGWNQWVLGYNQAKQMQLLQNLGFKNIDWRGMTGLLFAGIGLVLAAVAIFLWWRRLPPSADPVVRAYRRFLRTMARKGMAKNPAEGASDFARRIQRERPELADQVLLISGLYNRLRYGRHHSTELLRRFEQQVKSFR